MHHVLRGNDSPFPHGCDRQTNIAGGPHHHGLCCCSGEKPYVCTVPGCEKRFTEYSSLYKHHVVHTPCKPYNCNHCGKTYKQISTLAMHKRTAHNDTEPIEEEQEAYFEPPTGQYSSWLQHSKDGYWHWALQMVKENVKFQMPSMTLMWPTRQWWKQKILGRSRSLWRPRISLDSNTLP